MTTADGEHLYPPVAVRRATWWFSADGSGRFGLTPPEGTCYLATDAFAAIREATRLGPVSTDWMADRELCRVPPPVHNARLATATHQAVGRYGLTTELATMISYDLPRRWAAAFRTAEFGGVRHQLRHDQRARPSGIALFGPAGPADLDDGIRIPLTAADIEAAGVAALPPPHSTVLTVLP